MKKWLFACIVMLSCACNPSEVARKDPAMELRLAEFLKLYQKLDLEKMIDYIYPKIFNIVPKDQFLSNMIASIRQEDMKAEIDSIKIDIIYPIFEMDSARYAKAICSLVMILKSADFKNSEPIIRQDTSKTTHLITTEKYPAPKATLMQTLLNSKYGPENVTMDHKNGIVRVRAKNQIIAIKDKFAPDWSFITVDDESLSVTEKLFSKPVLDKLATLK